MRASLSAVLTPREAEVLELVMQGLTSKEAARALGISPKTVSVHRERVMDKFGTHNAIQLMRAVTEFERQDPAHQSPAPHVSQCRACGNPMTLTITGRADR